MDQKKESGVLYMIIWLCGGDVFLFCSASNRTFKVIWFDPKKIQSTIKCWVLVYYYVRGIGHDSDFQGVVYRVFFFFPSFDWVLSLKINKGG